MDPLVYDGTFLAGEHNGGFANSFNHGSYIYCYQSPVNLVDPNGKQIEWKKAWEKTKTFVKDVGDVAYEVAKTLAPIQPINFEEYLQAHKNVNGESYDKKRGEEQLKQWKELPNLPGKMLDAIGSLSWERLKEKYNNASAKEKVEILATIGVVMLSVKKGKIDTKDLIKLGGSYKKSIFIGGFKLVKETFHKTIKPRILSKSGDFTKKVGKNPNINVNKGDIILEGQGNFKGKTFKTGLKAKDYLK